MLFTTPDLTFESKYWCQYTFVFSFKAKEWLQNIQISEVVRPDGINFVLEFTKCRNEP